MYFSHHYFTFFSTIKITFLHFSFIAARCACSSELFISGGIGPNRLSVPKSAGKILAGTSPKTVFSPDRTGHKCVPNLQRLLGRARVRKKRKLSDQVSVSISAHYAAQKSTLLLLLHCFSLLYVHIHSGVHVNERIVRAKTVLRGHRKHIAK